MRKRDARCLLLGAVMLALCGCGAGERSPAESGADVQPPPKPVVSPATLRAGMPRTAKPPASVVSLPAAGQPVAALPECQPPTAVVARAGANAQRVELTWQKPFAEPEQYLIERSTDGKEFARAAIVSGAASGCIDTHGLTPQTAYTYRVRSWTKGQVSDASVTAQATTCNFRMFDSTLFRNKPNLASTGLQPLYVASETRFFAAATQWERRAMDADPVLTAEVAREAAKHGDMMVIDIECWPTDVTRDGKEAVDRTMRRMIDVLKWAKAAAPGLKIGYWGYPANVPYTSRAERDKALIRGRDAMRTLLPLFEAEDLVFPSFYAGRHDPELWATYARDTVAMARELGKPVYPFIMMQYEVRPNEVAAAIPPEFWQQQLQALRSTADGLVIWGGYQKQWDPDAPWWQATQRFVQPMQTP